MDIQPLDTQSVLTRVLQNLDSPFWKHGDFWISTGLGLIGVYVSYLAYRQAEAAKKEAEKAKLAATGAGRTVKLQTVCIDLTEIAQKLAVIDQAIQFEQATYLLADTSRHLLRVMAPFSDQPDFRDAISAVKAALQVAQASLKEVLPTTSAKEGEGLHTVYYATVDKFATINNCVAELTGLMEKHTYDFGRLDGER